MEPWISMYAACLDRIAEIANNLTDEQTAMQVPATPDWTVQQLYAHLAGAPADAIAGNSEGAGGPEWTGAQVAAREGASVTELVAEMRSNQEAITPHLLPDRPNASWDASVHLADLHEALGLGVPLEATWMPLYEAWKGKVPEALTGASAYEQFRALFSRRSRAQLESMASGSSEGLDKVGVFGPRDDDQPIP